MRKNQNWEEWQDEMQAALNDVMQQLKEHPFYKAAEAFANCVNPPCKKTYNFLERMKNKIKPRRN